MWMGDVDRRNVFCCFEGTNRDGATSDNSTNGKKETKIERTRLCMARMLGNAGMDVLLACPLLLLLPSAALSEGAALAIGHLWHGTANRQTLTETESGQSR